MNHEGRHDDRDATGARRVFEDAVDGLAPTTANRLRLMRRETLAGPRRSTAARLLPAAGFAAAVLALGLGWRLSQPPVLPQDEAAAAELEVDLVADEDAALYAWLGEAPVAEDGKL